MDQPAEPNPDQNAGFRKIIHIDMDAFYASVEQRDDPVLRGRPVAVGGSAARGVVAAASYEARKFGVRSAMPSTRAARLCPDLVFVPPRFEVYRAVSRAIHAIFRDYTPLIEPLSLDEAYLDVTADQRGIGSATRIAELIRQRIRTQTGLTASAGVSYNKFLAKLASDQNKPDGICVIRPGDGAAFVERLAVARFHGVGPRGAERMAALGVMTGGDLRLIALDTLRQHFGAQAGYLYRAARGIDLRSVEADRPRKSVGAERTFDQDIGSGATLRAALADIVGIVWARIEKAGARGRTVTLKLRGADFQTLTRAKSLPQAVSGQQEFAELGTALLETVLPLRQPVRLLGLTLSALEGAGGASVETAPGGQGSLPF